MASKAIPLSSYARELRIPIGSTADMKSFDLTEEVEITIKGKITRLEAAQLKGERYEGSEPSPAEITMNLTAVKVGSVENTFTKINKSMQTLDVGDD